MSTGECIVRCVSALVLLWQHWRLRNVVWVCRELVRAWGGSTELDGGCCFDREIDPLVVYEELMEGPDPHWGRYVVYVHWLRDTYGLDCTRRVLRTLEIVHPHHVPRILNFSARCILTPRCRPNNAPPS